MAWPAGGVCGIQNNINTPRVLATDSVKWTGEGVAAVVAETPEQAADALEAIDVDWEPLPAVVDAEKAIQPGAPQLHENAPNNIVFEWTVGDKAGTDAAFANAEVVVRQRLVNQRLIPNSMETRGDIGRYEPGHRRVHDLDVEPDAAHPAAAAGRVRDRHPGAQDPLHQPRTSAAPSARRSSATRTWPWSCSPRKALGGRPVKWVEGRRENYQSTIHGRDHITYLEIAAKRDGESPASA